MRIIDGTVSPVFVAISTAWSKQMNVVVSYTEVVHSYMFE